MSFQIKLVNTRKGDEHLNVLLTADAVSGLNGITLGKSTPLSDIPGGVISMESINSGRIYIGCGPLTNPPEPGGDQYYGWIEFSKVAPDPANGIEGDKGVWINLTNVDMTGLPLTLSGNDLDKKPFSLGYKTSMNDINKAIQTQALTTPNEPAVIKCKTGQTKILAPNKTPGSYEIETIQDKKTVRIGAFDQYLAELMRSQAKLVIQSDTPKDGTSKVYVGSFLNAQSDTDPIISLVNQNGDSKDTFKVLKGQFTSKILFECDGGTLIYQGETLPQNLTDKSSKSVITNSVFRNLLIGINEGYFAPDKVNYSNNFSFLTPFGRPANKFAEILHQSSNSYGFPYADSNLKVLIIADPATPIVLTAIEDDATSGYSDNENTANMPNGGAYRFVIGADSSELGIIRIGNCRYIASETNAYSGFLPTVDDWTKMIFGDENHYIWFKTTGDGLVVAQDCFLCGEGVFTPTWNKEHELVWGGSIKWNPKKSAPEKPDATTHPADKS